MPRKRLMILGAVVAVVIAAPIAWWLIRPLFITVTVNEDFPAVAAASSVQEPAATTAAPAEQEHPTVEPATQPPAATSTSTLLPEVVATNTPTLLPEVMTTNTPTLMPEVVATSMPVAQEPEAIPEAPPEETVAPPPAQTGPVALLTGSFHAVDHEGAGAATIYRLADGKMALRLENFEVENGPDLYVWLSGAQDANSAKEILDGGYISLGRLKGNQGNQNYELPEGLDLSLYHSVSIWCDAFSVNFATAPLR